MPDKLKATTALPNSGLPAGLILRNWQDDSDYEEMRRIVHADKHSQGVEESISTADLKNRMETMPGMDVQRGVFLIQEGNHPVAFKTLRRYPEASGLNCYNHSGFVLPEYKKRGIGRAMIRHSEQVLKELAAAHPEDSARTFQAFVDQRQSDSIHLLEQEGYRPVRYFYTMLRPDLENIPDVLLPDGFEVRPAEPEQMRTIWNALIEGFREHWGETDHGEEDYQHWLASPRFQPELWQIAWHNDRVASLVMNQIDKEDNAAYNRNRGFTDDIATLQEYRGRGLAQALIARGLRQLRDVGMTEAALDVDTENQTGALRLYEKLGYRPIRTMLAYRKPFTA